MQSEWGLCPILPKIKRARMNCTIHLDLVICRSHLFQWYVDNGGTTISKSNKAKYNPSIY